MRDIIFIIFAAMTLGSAAVTALSKNLVHSVFSLMATFFGVAALYVFLMADFLAIAQVMVYVGGILVLLIFGVMLTQKINSVVIIHGSVNRLGAIILGIFIFGLLAWVISGTSWYLGHSPAVAETGINEIGNLLMTKYLLGFEVVSVLLLGALLGAATIARGDAK